MTKMTQDAFDDVVAAHADWLNDEGGQQADLTGMDLSGLNMAGVNLSNANLSGVDLMGANLSGVDLMGADLSEADLSNAVMVDAYMSNAILTGTKMVGCNMTEVDASGVDLTNANLTGADLTGADLTGADLTNAILTGTKMAGTNLTSVDLMGTVMVNVDLSNAVMVDVYMTGADLKDVILGEENENYFRSDFHDVLSTATDEIHGLIDAIREGRIDGSSYEGECACLVGTVAKIRGVSADSLHRDANRPAERWFTMIGIGNKPNDGTGGGYAAAMAVKWAEEFCAERGIGFN